MGVLQELNAAQMSDALVGACGKHIPVMTMLRRADSWLNLRSRFLAIDGANLIFEAPVAGPGSSLEAIAPAENVGVSFKYKHHKHLFSSVVLSIQDYSGPRGETTAMTLQCPTSMQRIQRRAFYRAAIPANRIVRVSFWFGGRNSEPAGTTPEHPVWSGKVEDISAGGFQVRTRDDVGMGLDVGDTVGLRMTFGLSAEAIYADAQFRHAKPTSEGALLGFHLLGLGQGDEGKNALRVITGKVSEYQRLALPHRPARSGHSRTRMPRKSP